MKASKPNRKMALQRFKEAFLVALILGCVNTAGVNSKELNSTNFASGTEDTIKADSTRTETQSIASKVAKVSAATLPLASSSANLSEARITSITFRSEEADVDKENDETISFGIRSFTVEIATPATEKPIPLNEKFGAGDKINVQQSASSLPILTLENDQDRDDKVFNERAKVYRTPTVGVASVSSSSSSVSAATLDSLTPQSSIYVKNKQESIASSLGSANNMNIKMSRENAPSGPIAAHSSANLVHSTEQPTLSANNNNNNAHEQLSISSNGMHVEQKLENGLYRIKIAEITTDEFNNGQQNSDKKQLLDDTVLNRQQYIDKNENVMQDGGPPVMSQPSRPINIADLYPSKLEDFSSIIRESNEKLIEEKNRYVGLDNGNSGDRPIISDARFNIIDDANEQENSIQFGSENEASADHQKQHTKINGAFNSIENNIPTTKIEIELIDEPGASKDDVKIIGPGDDDDYVSPVERANAMPNNDKVTDFTSELQLKDDMVSKIEQSFRESSMANIQPPLQQQQPPQQQQPITINHPINPMGFIERRVKKFDPSFKKRLMQNQENTNRESSSSASSPSTTATNTKSVDENIISHSDEERKSDANIPNAKFYQSAKQQKMLETVRPNKNAENKQTNNNANSSKNQMLDNKTDELVKQNTNAESGGGGGGGGTSVHRIDSTNKEPILSTLEPINSTERKILFINVNNNANNTINKNELDRMQKDREQIIKESRTNPNANVSKSNGMDATSAPSTNMHLYIIHDDTIGQKPSQSIKTNYSNANKESPMPTSALNSTASSTTIAAAAAVASATATADLLNGAPSMKTVVTLNQTASKVPSAAAPALIDAISSTTETNSEKHSSSLNSITQSPISTISTMPSTTTMQNVKSTTTMNNQPMHVPKQKPFGRRGFDGFYFETECDMQTPIPGEWTVWRGNETHELNLPTTVSQFKSSLPHFKRFNSMFILNDICVCSVHST